MKYSISRRISITVIALAAILIALWIAELFSLVSVQAEASRQALTHSAQTTMNAVEAQIERYATAGRVLALSPALLRDDIATFEAEAARATTALGDAWVLLARPEGEQIFNTQRPVLVPNVGRSPAAMQAQRRAFQTGATQISDVGIGMLSREYVISVNLPIIREGQPRYLLAVVFSPRVFTKLMDGLPADWLAAVIDGNGNYATRSLNNDELIGQPAGEGWRTVMHQTGIFEFPSREGVPLIQATISSPRLGWASGVAMSRAALYAPLWKRAAISGVVAAIAVILCLAIVIGLGRRINSSLRLLERAVGNLRRQKPTVERTGEREIDSVIEAFNLTAGEISAHEQERAAHERQMRVAAREVTHRSKNLLAVTTAIAGLLSRDAPDAKTFSIRFNERLQALSRCQDLLIASNWTEATMEDVIESQLAPFTKEQFDLFGESVKIPAGSMQPSAWCSTNWPRMPPSTGHFQWPMGASR